MTNWRQIQARIRKARIGADAPAKLLSLYDKTHDAMVAFELARAYEKENRTEEAIDWYAKSIERFRRDDWKKKSAEAITRLGGTPPVWVPSPEAAPGDAASGGEAVAQGAPEALAESGVSAGASATSNTGRRLGAGLPSQLFYSSAAEDSGEGVLEERAEGQGEPSEIATGMPGAESTAGVAGTAAGGVASDLPRGKRRRRGRRGGRGRRKPGAPAPSVTPGAAAPQQSGHAQPARPAPVEHSAREERPRGPEHRPAAPPPSSAAAASSGPAGTADETGWVGPKTETLRARAGDPALASQIAQLEMQVRRLIACPPHKLEDADLAPAGPGVLIFSDSDLTTHYYVVACATLRIEMGRLGRSDRGARGRDAGPSLRSRLAEHLGINESQVTRYLNQHCVARWLQLDEGASRLAHFAIAVLRPPLND